MFLRKQPSVKHNNWWALLVVMGGVFLSTMDSGMVNIAIPTMMRHFNLAIEETELVVTTYLLTITITLVFWGRFADWKGLKNVYLSGLLVFSLGAWFCYFSKSYSLLLFARFVQGLGAAMMMTSGPAIIKTSFSVDKLGRNLGLVGIATACGLLTGPFVSGHLLMIFSWRSIFVVLGLLSCIICCMAFILFGVNEAPVERYQTGRFDWLGGVCWSVIVIVMINLLQNVNQFSLISFTIKISLLVVLLYCFIYLERKVLHPLLPLDIFQNRYYWVGVTTATLSFLSLFSVLVLVPFYLEYILHYNGRQIGSVMMAVPATLILLSPSAGYLYDKIGAKYLTSTGLLISCGSLIGLAQLSQSSSNVSIILLLALMGAGQSIFLSPNSASVLSRVGDMRVGATSGILATARNFGMVVGATLATVLFSYFSSGISPGVSMNDLQNLETSIFVQSLSYTFRCIAGVSFVASMMSMLRD